MINNRKYKRIAAVIFLMGYILFFVLASFHSHNYIIPGKTYFTEYSKTNKDPFAVGDSSCLLAQINGSIHSYFYANYTSANSLKELTVIINFYNLLIPSENFHKYPSLRAPPEILFYS